MQTNSFYYYKFFFTSYRAFINTSAGALLQNVAWDHSTANYIGLASDCSFISGGQGNNIGAVAGGGAGAIFGAIGGGLNNCIDDNGAPTSYGVIGGGQLNCIFPGTHHSSIFSGQNNCVADNCSSILGGVGNTIPAGFPNAHIAGSNIVLSAGVVGNPNPLHVNNLWLDPATYFSWLGTPPPLTFPPGTVYVDTTAGNNYLRVF